MRHGILSIVLPVLVCAAAWGQTAEPLAFEVASVKAASPPADGRMMSFMNGGPGSADPGRISYTGVAMMALLMRAYDAKTFQVTGPAWLGSERYDVTAKIPEGTTKEQFRTMLQNLLAERFHLAVHRESKELPGYELVVAKNGVKMKQSSAADAELAAKPPSGPPGPMGAPGPPKRDGKGFPVLERPGMMMMMTRGEKGGMVARMVVKAQDMPGLVQMLGQQLQRPVVDKSGLTGRFDFTLEYAPDSSMFGGAPMGAGGGRPEAPLEGLEDSGPTIIGAVQDQLGLKLESKKVPMEMVIVDRIEKVPTEN